MRATLWYGALALALLATPASAQPSAQTAVSAGRLVVDAPTLTGIGVEWKITGDDNRNAAVEVSYRKKGETAWRKALPLLRIHHEVINSAEVPFHPVDPTPANPNGERENPWHYDTGNMFAGSVLNLQPDTDYECRLVLSDPDGVSGEKEKTITVHTRKEPQPPAAAHFSCLSHRLEGADAAALLHWPDARLQYGLIGVRSRSHLSAARAARRRDPGPCRPLYQRPLPLHEWHAPSRLQQSGGGDGRHLLPHPERHARQADRDQGGG